MGNICLSNSLEILTQMIGCCLILLSLCHLIFNGFDLFYNCRHLIIFPSRKQTGSMRIARRLQSTSTLSPTSVSSINTQHKPSARNRDGFLSSFPNLKSTLPSLSTSLLQNLNSSNHDHIKSAKRTEEILNFMGISPSMQFKKNMMRLHGNR